MPNGINGRASTALAATLPDQQVLPVATSTFLQNSFSFAHAAASSTSKILGPSPASDAHNR